MRFVPIKTIEQQAIFSTLQVFQGFVKHAGRRPIGSGGRRARSLFRSTESWRRGWQSNCPPNICFC
jgi:hypothetical protein